LIIPERLAGGAAGTISRKTGGWLNAEDAGGAVQQPCLQGPVFGFTQSKMADFHFFRQ